MMKRTHTADKVMAIGIAPHAASRTVAGPRATDAPQAGAWFWSVTVAVVVWSLSYLIRQPGVATSSLVLPYSPIGDFALEGMLLALSWLGVLAAVCLAVLTGAARIVER